MTFTFGTKAESLERLQPLISIAKFCAQVTFTVADWRANRQQMTRQVLTAFDGGDLVVRSSARREDGHEASLAGAFLSVVGVRPTPGDFADAVNRVIESYDAADPMDQILVQPLLQNIVISGVVLTRDLDTGAPYFVVNYDDVSGRTDQVTGGAESKTILVHRARPDGLKSTRMRALIDAVVEVEQATGSDELDIEFCIDAAGDHYILQVRPLAARRHWVRRPSVDVDRAIDGVRGSLEGAFLPEPGLAGRTTIFGQMPDWNPAEMIGGMPRPLAYSLYAGLITDSVWAEARAELGYRDLRSKALMVSFCGQPFIDVRRSLNSFLPADLDPNVAEKIVNGQLDRLAQHREFHDRIEFAVAMPSEDFALDQRVGELREAGLSNAEIRHFRDSLAALTRRIISDSGQTMRRAEERIDALEQFRAAHVPVGLDRMQALVAECMRNGTRPFAMLARHGFIGVSYLRSLVTVGAIDEAVAERFLESIHTVAADFVDDVTSLSEGSLNRATFLQRYGHLRPGTYDITSPRYDEMDEGFLGHAAIHRSSAEAFEMPTEQLRNVDQLMKSANVPLGVKGLFDYIGQAVRLREYAKFVFTRTVSDILNIIVRWGDGIGLSRDDLSFLTLADLRADQNEASLRQMIARARDADAVSRLVRLPHLIDTVEDVDVIRVPMGEPTYITRKAVTASVVILEVGEVVPIDGRIVLTERADPGFDWIFSHDIKGLVTKFGGANSHMAIRCAEFGLPAAIGCGDRLFASLAHAQAIELNCASQTVRPTAIL